MNKTKGINRRSFIKQSTMGIIGGGIVSSTGHSYSQAEVGGDFFRIKEYHTLGRTGFKVSDLSAGHTADEGLLRTFLDAGVNYLDASEGYRYNERIIGKSMPNLDRSSLFITSKVLADTSYKHISKSDVTKAGFLRRAYRIMESLRTDYLDCLMISGPETVEMLKDKEFHAATEQLKKEGRLRHVGVSHHGSQLWDGKPKEPMGKILLAAVEDGRFDVMLLAYNFLKEDMSEHVLEVCGKKNIGTTLMKVNPIRSYNEMKEYFERTRISKGEELNEEERESLTRMEEKVENAQVFLKRHNLKSQGEIRTAAIKFVLSNPHVNTVCLSVANYDEMLDYLKISGSRLETRDKELLAAYKKECGSLYCRHACGLCEPQCPYLVPVNTIMRYDHYFVSQGREKYAMAKYAALKSQKADRCQSCAGHCESTCPYGVPVQALLAAAHRTLSLGSIRGEA